MNTDVDWSIEQMILSEIFQASIFFSKCLKWFSQKEENSPVYSDGYAFIYFVFKYEG